MFSSIIQNIRTSFESRFGEQVTGRKPNATDVEQPSEEYVPVELPPDLQADLARSLAALDHSSVYSHAIGLGLETALDKWHETPEAPNSLVILGSPSEHLDSIIRYAINQWESQDYMVIQLGKDWGSRPADYQAIAAQLEHELQGLPPPRYAADLPPIPDRLDEATATRQSIVLLPMLDWCFLRCVGGFDAINLLRQTIVGDRSRFWVVGCNDWAWLYLDYVCQIKAYFEQTLTLPSLESEDLKEWLAPVMKPLDITIEQNKKVKHNQWYQRYQQTTDEDEDEVVSKAWNSIQEKRYFERLAAVSHGLSCVAADLWLRSLSVTPQDDQPDNDENGSQSKNDKQNPNHGLEQSACFAHPDSQPDLLSDEQPHESIQKTHLTQGNVSLPNLPPLTTGDRYLLYSLVLHGNISLLHLAISLGEEEGRIHAQVRVLLRAGLINREQGQLCIDPVYYPGIRSDLERNNFLVGNLC